MVRTKGYSDTPQTESSRRASPFCNGSREPLNPINTSSAPRKNAPQWGAPAWCGRRDSNPHGCPQEPEDVHSSWFLMIKCNLPKKFPKMSHSFHFPGLAPGSFLLDYRLRRHTSRAPNRKRLGVRAVSLSVADATWIENPDLRRLLMTF